MPDDEVTIERAHAAQAEAIYQLLLECGREMTERGLRNWDPPPGSPGSIRTEIAGDVVLSALAADDELVGTVTLRALATHDYAPDEAAGRVAWGAAAGAVRYMNRLAVHPAWQGTGLGSRLMAASEAEARAAGAAALRFDVLEANRELIGWYERRGAAMRGRRRHSGKDFVVMEKAL